jgi:hypothetical protein
MSAPRRVRQREIARLAGISQAVAALVSGNKPGWVRAGEETRQKILQLGQHLRVPRCHRLDRVIPLGGKVPGVPDVEQPMCAVAEAATDLLVRVIRVEVSPGQNPHRGPACRLRGLETTPQLVESGESNIHQASAQE